MPTNKTKIPESEFWDFLIDYQKSPQYEGKIKNPITDQEIKFNALRHICLNDLYKFNKYVLGYNDMYEPLHGPWCDWIQKNHENKKSYISLLPRGHFKSSIDTIGASVQDGLKNPDVKIQISNITHDKAKKFLHEIRGHFETNTALRALFPDIVPIDTKQSERWTNEALTLLRSRQSGTATYEVAGTDTKTVGSHYNIQIYDDIIDDATVRSAKLMEDVLKWFQMSLFLLNPGGELRVIGTRYHFVDFYHYIIEKYVKARNADMRFEMIERRALEGPNVDRFVKSIMVTGQSTEKRVSVDKDVIWRDQPIFPTRWSKKELKRYIIGAGTTNFYNQMMNFPIDPEEQVFKREKCTFFNEIPSGCRRYITVDPSVGESDRSDMTSIIDVRVDWAENWYVENAVYARLNEPQIVAKIFDLYHTGPMPPHAVGFETQGFQKNIYEAFQREMQLQQTFVNIEELKHHGRSKDSRIRALQYFYEKGMIQFHKDVLPILELEMFRYPRAKHDDFLDALAYMLDLIRVYGYPTVPSVVKNQWMQAYQKRYKTRNNTGFIYGSGNNNLMMG